MNQDMISMSVRTLGRYEVTQQLIAGKINGSEAAKQLGLSIRQVKRLKKQVKKRGVKGLIHGNTGRPSNRRIGDETQEAVLSIIKKQYADFGPTFAHEKLTEEHHVHCSVETVRTLMTGAKLWKPKPRKESPDYRTWRPRKEHFGELQQFDGSYHRWFEDRGPEMCLLAAIDDATGTITRAEFADNEGVRSVFGFWKEYLEELGAPGAIYLDKYSTYKINHAAAVDNSELMTQFQRAAKEVGVSLITAHSPQAKGRIERLFQTLQDRLVKELRLRGISDRASANEFLRTTFIPEFNARFSVVPAKQGNTHRTLTAPELATLPQIFSVQSKRSVMNDFTLRFKNQFYQLHETQPVTVCRTDPVIVEERLDGTIHLRHLRRGKYLAFTVLPERPKRAIKTPVLTTTTGRTKAHTPAENHPWKQPFLKKIARYNTTILNTVNPG
jgi:transposase